MYKEGTDTSHQIVKSGPVAASYKDLGSSYSGNCDRQKAIIQYTGRVKLQNWYKVSQLEDRNTPMALKNQSVSIPEDLNSRVGLNQAVPLPYTHLQMQKDHQKT